MQHKIIFIIGVSGSGKTTIGKLLAEKTGYAFYDADDFHPQHNIDKMKAGEPLNDADRLPWLQKLHSFSKEQINTRTIIIACSALKTMYRQQLSKGIEASCRWVFLKGSYDTVLKRMQQRDQHYMPASLLQSQFDALELPQDAIEAAISLPPAAIVELIVSAIN